MVAEEEIEIRGNVAALGHRDERRRGRERVDVGEEADGVDPLGHLTRERDDHDDTGGGGRVGEVLTDAAEELLDDDDRGHAAESRLPERNGDGQVKRENHARDDRREVIDGDVALAELFKEELREDAGAGADRDHEQGAPSEKNGGGDFGGHERDNDVEHNFLRVARRVEMRRHGEYELVHHLPSFLLF